MARQNVPLLSFNRGLISPRALGRVDLDRTRLSAAVFTNWLPKTQGAMRIRPGTKYLGSSISDTGAEFIEFVASTNDTALIELTHQKMRIWLPSDTGRSNGALAFETPVGSGLDVPLARPKVDTTVTLSDTGWSNTSTGGTISTSADDAIPTMTAATTNGVTISASSENTVETTGFGEEFPEVPTPGNRNAWRAADDNNQTIWMDTGQGNASTLPSWWKVDFGASNLQSITSYSLRAGPGAYSVNNAPKTWLFQRSTDDNTWVTEDTQGSEVNWAVNERRTYSLAAADTGTIEATQYWRLYITALAGDSETILPEVEMFNAASALQVKINSGVVTLNATSIGGLARREKRVIVSDTGIEHSLAIDIERGPVTLRVGSTQRDDDYVGETSLGTGYHNLAFTPQTDFWITLQSDAIIDRKVRSLAIGDSGTVEVTTFIDAADLSNVRYDQSADVVYVDCDGVSPHKIERRGTGRSWSFVKYLPQDGPFLSFASSTAKLHISHKYGNTDLNSDIPFFTSNHTGTLFRMFNDGQSGVWPLGALNAATDAIKVTGISDTGDTGTPSQGSERRITISVAGTYVGTLQIERSFEGEESGFHPVSTSAGYIKGGTTATDTGTFTRVINDPDDNATAWYRVRMTSYTSGVALVTLTHPHGGVNGICRVIGYNSNTNVDVEVLSRFSDTGPTELWQEGAWSDARGFPTSVALHEGRLGHAARGTLYLSESDDYEGFNDETVGDAGPIARTLGSGPVDSIQYLVSLLRLIIGTSGSELSMRSSSLDEPLTPTNSSAKTFSTQGSANIRSLKLDASAVFVQRSGKRLFMIGQGSQSISDYDISELTVLVPELLIEGVVSIAVQRQPDTRIHCVLGNGKVAILTYEPREEVLCWSKWETDGTVEKVAVLPGTGSEDKVYYHVNRTINGTTKRFLEIWATEAESEGDTGLSWLADCAKSYTDTGRATTLTGFSHLVAESVIAWGDDTGQAIAGRDLSTDDTGGDPRTYTVSGSGEVDISSVYSPGVHHAVVGLPYTADWTSTKLAYAAEAGTALAQMKRTDKIAFVLYNTHNRGLYFGNDTGNLDALPRVSDGGATVDDDKIFATFDQVAMPFPGLWDSDARIHLRAKAPRPVTVLAAVPTVQTNEKI